MIDDKSAIVGHVLVLEIQIHPNQTAYREQWTEGMDASDPDGGAAARNETAAATEKCGPCGEHRGTDQSPPPQEPTYTVST